MNVNDIVRCAKFGTFYLVIDANDRDVCLSCINGERADMPHGERAMIEAGYQIVGHLDATLGAARR